MHDDRIRIVLVTGTAGKRGGGEAARPLHYFEGLLERGVDVHMFVHARSRADLADLERRHPGRIRYFEDRSSERFLARIRRRSPESAVGMACAAGIHLLTQGRQRRALLELLADGRPTIVHQPYPISPVVPSRIARVGAPVVIGPLNGNMRFPPAFRSREPWTTRLGIPLMRRFAGVLGLAFRGKRDATLLLVANRRTEEGMPPGSSRNCARLIPNAVDAAAWSRPGGSERRDPGAPVRFAFFGRLVPFKGVDLLLEAAAALPSHLAWELEVIGEGSERPRLEGLAADLGIASQVRFRGWLGGAELVSALSRADVFAFPSLRESGGAAVLEAMALELPVIAADWGGPADYVSPECAMLVPVDSREALIGGLTGAMRKLAADPALRRRMGRAGRARVLEGFLWRHRLDALIQQYGTIAAQAFPEARILPGTKSSTRGNAG